MDGETITEGWRALDLFTNRVDASRRFCVYLNEDPPPSSVLVFHGNGGNGKSLLLQRLRTHLCKRITSDNWAYLKSLSDEECIAQVASAADATPVPVGRLDFAQDPKDGFGALLKLRRDLSGTGLRFPLFDFAVITYLHKAKQLTDDRLRSLFPSDDLDFILELAGLIREMPGAGLVVEFVVFLDRRLGRWFQRYQQQRGLDTVEVAAIQRMDHETELIQNLPQLFARDLNTALGGAGGVPRVALLFDTHEAFWGHDRDLEGDLYFGRDEWLRRLVISLDRSAGAVVVVAGREVPRWAAAPRYPVSDLEPHLVEELTDADAFVYLERAGVGDSALRDRLCNDARVGLNEVHPFYLGLGADLALVAARKGVTLAEADLELDAVSGSRRQRLVHRLLRYVDAEVRDAVAAVATCRSFDRAIYRYLGQELDYPTSRAGFAVLTGFSFVQVVGEPAEGRYRIHDLLRRLLDSENDGLRAEADAALERYFRQASIDESDVAIVEAIYHANRIDWERGVHEWCEMYKRATRSRRVDVCRRLDEVREILHVKTPMWNGEVARVRGYLLFTLSQYHEAQQELEQATVAFATSPKDRDVLTAIAIVSIQLGEIHQILGRYDAAEISLREAVSAYDAALRLAPEDVFLLNAKGFSFFALGHLQTQLGQREAAEASLREAIAANDAALQLMPEDVTAIGNKGDALKQLAAAQDSLGQQEAAEASLREAIAAYDAALRFAPEDVTAIGNKGNTLKDLAKLQDSLGQREAAEASLRDAVAAYDAALRLAPNQISILDAKGQVFEQLGTLQRRWSRLEAAEASLQKAVAAYAAALRIAPGDWLILTVRGSALKQLGEIEQRLNRLGESEATLQAAVATHGTALRLAPPNMVALILSLKGDALVRLGELHVQMSRTEDAKAELNEAVAAYDDVLRLRPDDVNALITKARGLSDLGTLEGKAGQRDSALSHFRAAETACDVALQIAPLDGSGLNVLGRLAVALDRLGAMDEAEEVYHRYLTLSPHNANAIGNLAGLLLATGRSDEGLELLNKALQLVTSGDQASLLVELWYYAFAHNPGRDRVAALRELRVLLERGERSLGWDLSRNAKRAKLEHHPDGEWLDSLAAVISEGQSLAMLTTWSVWQAAVPTS